MRLFKSHRHRRWQQDVSAYIDGRLEPHKQQALEMHLAECVSCREEMEALRGVVTLLHRLPQVPVPRSFALSEAPVRRMGWGILYAAPLRYATAAAALLLLAIAVGDLVTDQPTAIAPDAAPAAERREEQAPDEALDKTAFTAESPTGEGIAVPAVTPTPQPVGAGTPEKAGEDMTETALAAPAPEELRTEDTLFRWVWVEVALGVLLAVLAVLVATQWWLGRRRRVKY
ncbi:anti-sigma factor family protein [Chloroflexota bacterium]